MWPLGTFPPRESTAPGRGLGGNWTTIYMGDIAFLFYFRRLRKPIVTKQQFYRPKRLSSNFPPKPLCRGGTGTRWALFLARPLSVPLKFRASPKLPQLILNCDLHSQKWGKEPPKRRSPSLGTPPGADQHTQSVEAGKSLESKFFNFQAHTWVDAADATEDTRRCS